MNNSLEHQFLNLLGQYLMQALSCPQHHSAEDCCQDILDAIKHGEIDRETGLKAINLIMSEKSRQVQKPVELPLNEILRRVY